MKCCGKIRSRRCVWIAASECPYIRRNDGFLAKNHLAIELCLSYVQMTKSWIACTFAKEYKKESQKYYMKSRNLQRQFTKFISGMSVF